jgi:hypothetical protein
MKSRKLETALLFSDKAAIKASNASKSHEASNIATKQQYTKQKPYIAAKSQETCFKATTRTKTKQKT